MKNKIVEDLTNGKVKKVILDTDTYNEVDDQFALAYSILTPDIDLISVNAAPFQNDISRDFEDGMLKSYDEILKIMELTGHPGEIPVFKGSRAPLKDRRTPQPSEAAENIINTVMSTDERIYVIATGVSTNVASALLMEPKLAERNLTVVWLGCNRYEHNLHYEFNMGQDIPAASVLFDSGVDLIDIPAFGVTSHMLTSLPELRDCILGKNALCDYLYSLIEKEIGKDTFAGSRIVFDIAAPVLVADPECAEWNIIPTPRLSSDGEYAIDVNRKPYIYVNYMHRDIVFRRCFEALITAK